MQAIISIIGDLATKDDKISDDKQSKMENCLYADLDIKDCLENYNKLFKVFGTNIKFGIYNNYGVKAATTIINNNSSTTVYHIEGGFNFSGTTIYKDSKKIRSFFLFQILFVRLAFSE